MGGAFPLALKFHREIFDWSFSGPALFSLSMGIPIRGRVSEIE